MAEQKPLVSVIIPCYNQAHFVTFAIDSALAQTYGPIEVVVVNDGSKDDTSGVVRGYADRVRLIEQPNAGLSAARNTAIAESKGEYVLLLDSDDILEPGCIESRLAHCLDTPDIGIVCGAFSEVDEEAKHVKVEGIRRELPAANHLGAVLRANYGPPSGWLIRRRALELCGLFDPHLRSCEDWDLLIRISSRYRVAYDRSPQVQYRQVATSMSRNHLVMYDAAAMMFKKNRILPMSRLAYWWNTQVGMFNHCVGNLLARPLQEHGAGRAAGIFFKLGLRRPPVLAYFVAWGIRVVRNRLLWVFGAGPLRQRT